MHPYLAELLSEAHVGELRRQAAHQRLAGRLRQRRAAVGSLRLAWRTVRAATTRPAGPGSPHPATTVHDAPACCAV